MKRRRVLLALILALAWAPGIGSQEGQVPSPPSLRVHFIDVGQGDAVLIQAPSGQNVVYDAGEHPQRVRDYLVEHGIARVDLVIASHNHADHIGGLAAVLRTFRPRFYMDNGIPTTTLTYARTLEAAGEVGSQLLDAVERRIALGDAAILVIPRPGLPAWDQNDNSIGVVVEYGQFRLSLSGDAEEREWARWLTNYPGLIPAVQVHKASHHGSINGDTAAGISRLAPKTVVINVGEANRYGHPDARALARYAGVGATVYRTDRHGTIVIDAQPNGTYVVQVENTGVN